MDIAAKKYFCIILFSIFLLGGMFFLSASDLSVKGVADRVMHEQIAGSLSPSLPLEYSAKLFNYAEANPDAADSVHSDPVAGPAYAAALASKITLDLNKDIGNLGSGEESVNREVPCDNDSECGQGYYCNTSIAGSASITGNPTAPIPNDYNLPGDSSGERSQENGGQISTKFSNGTRLKVIANNIQTRSIAAGGDILSSHNNGDLGKVIGGPQYGVLSGVGYWWWQINYESGSDGWSVENFLEKVKFSAGDKVIVTANNVQVRDDPSAVSIGRRSRNINDTGIVISGPRFTDSNWWWEIRYSDGDQGWSAENWLEKTDVVKKGVCVPIKEQCVGDWQSLGAVVPGNNKVCCEGLVSYVPGSLVGTRGICVKTCTDNESCDLGSCFNGLCLADSCSPEPINVTCSKAFGVGYQCGTTTNNCGVQVNCGGCGTTDYVCSNTGTCVCKTTSIKNSGNSITVASAGTCTEANAVCGTVKKDCENINCGPENQTCTQAFGNCTVTGIKNCINNQYGVCQATDPRPVNCAGKQCGSDLCGGSCGTCNSGEKCGSSGQCVPNVCAKDCSGRTCGSDPVCGQSCGTCSGGQTCNTTGSCVNTCTDSDGGKNYYTKGNGFGPNGNGGMYGFEDFCYTGRGQVWNKVTNCSGSECYLSEAYCDSVPTLTGSFLLSDQDVVCPNGCVNGACANVTTSQNQHPEIKIFDGPTVLNLVSGDSVEGVWTVRAKDPEGKPLKIKIEWGDGAYGEYSDIASDSTFTKSHAYSLYSPNTQYTYSLKLTVTDDKGLTVTDDTKKVVVSGPTSGGGTPGTNSINILSPALGATWNEGGTGLISWTAPNSVSKVWIYLLRKATTPENSYTSEGLIANGVISVGGITNTYSWPISGSGTKYVEIISENNAYSNLSFPFTIVAGTPVHSNVFSFTSDSLINPTTVYVGQSSTWSVATNAASSNCVGAIDYVVDWGDNTPKYSTTTSCPLYVNNLALTHAYLSNGSFNLNVKATAHTSITTYTGQPDAMGNNVPTITNWTGTIEKTLPVNVIYKPLSIDSFYFSTYFGNTRGKGWASALGGYGNLTFAINWGDDISYSYPGIGATSKSLDASNGPPPADKRLIEIYHTYADAGTRTATLTVTDTSGHSATKSIQITTTKNISAQPAVPSTKFKVGDNVRGMVYHNVLNLEGGFYIADGNGKKGTIVDRPVFKDGNWYWRWLDVGSSGGEVERGWSKETEIAKF